jgi:hypothetical protein
MKFRVLTAVNIRLWYFRLCYYVVFESPICVLIFMFFSLFHFLVNLSSGEGHVIWNLECQEKIARHNVDLIGVQEVRWGGGGNEPQYNYTLGEGRGTE